MKKIHTLTLILLLFFYFGNAFSQKTVNICYIANEGFLVELNGKKILFDGLFGGFDADWCDIPSPEIKTKLENSEPPFDNIDLIFISHNHIDHFNKDMVINHSLKDSNCRIICPVQVLQKLETHNDFHNIKNKIFAYTPDFSQDSAVSINGTNIKIYRLEHCQYFEKDSLTGKEVNRHQNVENLGYLVNFDGIKIFHSGDINPWNEDELKIFNLQNESIDIAFLERLFLTNQQGRGIEIIQNYINPGRIIFMHIESKNKKIYNNIIKYLSDIFPDVYIFDNSMENKEIILN
jgi:L-ascorbate metabolism protein UlaG (beta-lactamase superfamily)